MSKQPRAYKGGSSKTKGVCKLTVQSRPWAKVFIDGKDTERFTPAAEMVLAVGKHTVKLVNEEENLGATFTVIIKPGQTASVMKELK